MRADHLIYYLAGQFNSKSAKNLLTAEEIELIVAEIDKAKKINPHDDAAHERLLKFKATLTNPENTSNLTQLTKLACDKVATMAKGMDPYYDVSAAQENVNGIRATGYGVAVRPDMTR